MAQILDGKAVASRIKGEVAEGVANLKGQPVRLDVILVNWKSEETPEEAEYLAQVNQTGGSDSQDMERPSAPDKTVCSSAE